MSWQAKPSKEPKPTPRKCCAKCATKMPLEYTEPLCQACIDRLVKKQSDAIFTKIFGSVRDDKIQGLAKRASSVQNNLPISIRELISVLGLMTIPAVQWAKYHLRPLQIFLLKKQQEDLDRTLLYYTLIHTPKLREEVALVVEDPHKSKPGSGVVFPNLTEVDHGREQLGMGSPPSRLACSGEMVPGRSLGVFELEGAFGNSQSHRTLPRPAKKSSHPVPVRQRHGSSLCEQAREHEESLLKPYLQPDLSMGRRESTFVWSGPPKGGKTSGRLLQPPRDLLRGMGITPRGVQGNYTQRCSGKPAGEYQILIYLHAGKIPR